METLQGLERASRPSPKAHKALTREEIKSLKGNNCKNNKHRATSSAPKPTPSPALELAKTTLRRAS